MIIRKVSLETVCGITSRLPENTLPEIAFAGKSNVGKSSLINGLMNRKSLARTSAQPGKTQTINFYNVNDAFYLVDLPGYGYARVSEEVSSLSILAASTNSLYPLSYNNLPLNKNLTTGAVLPKNGHFCRLIPSPPDNNTSLPSLQKP